MTADPTGSGSFESARQDLADKTPNELIDIFADRFDDDFPSEGLYAGTRRDRIWQFVLNRVQSVCNGAADTGRTVWEALQDDHTAHNTERFALVCGFFASQVFPGGHWHLHEIAAFVLLILTIRPKTGGSS